MFINLSFIRKIPTVLLLVFSVSLFGQTIPPLGTCSIGEDFESVPSGFTVENISWPGNPDNPLWGNINGNEISIGNSGSGSRGVVFNNARCAYRSHRVFRSLNTNLCDSWIAHGEFRVTAVGSNTQPIAHLVFSATSNNTQPFRTERRVFTDNDIVGLLIGGDGNGLVAVAVTKDGANAPNQTDIGTRGDLRVGTTYVYKVERIDSRFGEVTIYDKASGFVISTGCFDIPAGVTDDLGWLQLGNNPGGGHSRLMSGWVDNICIQNCDEELFCCMPDEINGPSTICLPNLDGEDYWVDENPDLTYTWSIIGGSSLASLSGSGNRVTLIPNGSAGVVTLQLVVECGCKEMTLTKEITLVGASNYPMLVQQNTGGSPWTFTANNPAGVPGSIQTDWEIYEAANNIALDYTISSVNSSPLTTATGSSISHSTAASTSAKSFIIIQRFTSPEGCVNTYVKKEILTPTTSQKVDDSSPVVTMSEALEMSGGSLLSESNEDIQERISVSPNPTSGQFSVQTEFDSPFSYSVISAEGKSLMSGESQSQLLELDLSSFPSGVYFIRLLGDDDQVIVQKVVKD